MAASQLLGDVPVRFWHDQLFCKPPKKRRCCRLAPGLFLLDRTKPLAHLTCWCGLDDSTKKNGRLQYVPGSHRWGLLDKPALAGDLMGILDYLTPATTTVSPCTSRNQGRRSHFSSSACPPWFGRKQKRTTKARFCNKCFC